MVLTEREIKERIKKGSGWCFSDGGLRKSYKHKDFLSAVLFLNKAVNPIEEYQSYPKIELSYNVVSVFIFNAVHGGIREEEIKLMQDLDLLTGSAQEISE